MKRFRFTLDWVLEHRSRKLEQAQRNLAQARIFVRQLEARLEELRSDLVRPKKNLASTEVMDGADLRALSGFRKRVRSEIEKLEQSLEQAHEKLRGRNEEYISARRDCRLLEQLKTRRRLDWQQQADREAEKESSDLFLSRWKTKSRQYSVGTKN